MKAWLALLAGAWCAAAPAQDNVQSYPTRNLRLIVPFNAGAGPDATGRQLAQGLSERFKRNVIVDNWPGASGGMMPAVTDIIRGDVLFACSVTSNVATLINGGRLKALGLLGPKRISALPDVPAFAELGLPDVDVTSWGGIAAPLATSPAVRRRLAAVLREISDDPSHAKAFTALGLETAYLPMEPFGAVIQSEVSRWAKFVKETGLRIDCSEANAEIRLAVFRAIADQCC